MTQVSLLPATTTSNTGAVTGGGGDADAVMRDVNDSTYITFDSGEKAVFTLDDLTLPSGAILYSAQAVVRAYVDPAYLFSISVLRAGVTTDELEASTDTAVNWTTPQTVRPTTLTNDLTDVGIDAATLEVGNPTSAIPLTVSECSLRVTYLVKPVADVTSPAGTVTSNAANVRWSTTWDPNYTPTTGKYKVKLFTEAQFTAGGFNTEFSSALLNSGVQSLSTAAVQKHDFGEALENGTYRAYVKTQAIEDQWSDWDYEEFVVDADLPGEPTLVLTPEDASGRVQIDLDDTAGDAATDSFQVQRFTGEEWVDVRTIEGGGIITGTDETIWDYEAPNGVTVTYQARAILTTTNVYSAWVEATTLLTGEWWLKHPTIPAANVQIELASFESHTRTARQSVLQPLGRADPVVVSDTRSLQTGSLTIRLRDDDTRDAVAALATYTTPLLLQAKYGDHEPDRWIVLGDEEITRLIDQAWADERNATYAWTEVARPDGDITEWPDDEPDEEESLVIL